MNTICEEQINFSSFLKYANTIQNKYGYLFPYPDDLCALVKVLNHPTTQKPYGVIISTSSPGTNNDKLRIRLEDPNGNTIYGTFRCIALMKYDENNTLHHEYFSFHFEPDNKQNTYSMFRFDLEPSSPTPLHAHDNKYKESGLHLVFPKDTLLNLHLIDFFTALQILAYYYEHPDKYPLSFGEVYTQLIERTRRIYDEQRKHNIL